MDHTLSIESMSDASKSLFLLILLVPSFLPWCPVVLSCLAPLVTARANFLHFREEVVIGKQLIPDFCIQSNWQCRS